MFNLAAGRRLPVELKYPGSQKCDSDQNLEKAKPCIESPSSYYRSIRQMNIELFKKVWNFLCAQQFLKL
jgi:hypothetical protein